MTIASLSLLGESETPTVDVIDLERVRVSFPAELGGEVTCKHCGEPIDEIGGEWQDEGDEHPEVCEENDAGHEPPTGPGSWCNSASIDVDEAENSVTVTISVGDPRGAFAMTVRRVPAIYDGDLNVVNPKLAGKILLQVPYEGMGFAHMPLTLVHEGAYVLGGE